MLRAVSLRAGLAALLLGTGPAVSAAALPDEIPTAARAAARVAAPGGGEERWALDVVDASAAWKVTKGAGVVVALLGEGQPDTGLPELAGRVERGPDMTGTVIGDETQRPGDDATGLASVIAGSGSGGGFSGVAPEARVLSLPVTVDRPERDYVDPEERPEETRDSPLARGIRYATAQGAKVICLPVPAYGVDRVERDAISFALARGVVLVAAAGDAGQSAYTRQNGTSFWAFPAGYPGVVGVGAVDRRGGKTSGSSDNLSVLVAAPGERVPVALPGGRRGTASGTGVASAIVAGTIALIKAKYPDLPPELVSRALTATSRPHPPAGYDDKVGFGVVDAAAALAKAGELVGYGHASAVQDDAHFGKGPVSRAPARPGPDPVRLWVYGIAVVLGIGGFCAAALALSRR
ncbi:S8 family serine peptidase [Microbispora triticiradicis]|uniref:S8 family serine peptidase n=2 Tax=Microbispora TaxID=2005 RepID=A0ABY3LZH4_9ACTN|nr:MULTISPECIES: S8 family serine peptidase [Microbispora]TLP53545.1 serine protease [Microbispora fusca]TYB61194.1 S8 family serine peptidase [Microbispora tritici]